MTRCALAIFILVPGILFAESDPARPRLVILTDIGGDPDDQQSLVRLMTYANEFEIEGLIASASGTPGELKQHVVRPDLIRKTVEAYGEVRENLLRHAEGFPKAAQLLSTIKSGNPVRGVKSVGEDHDTEGSNWIVSVVDRADTRPVNVAIWGGATELAQALWHVRNERGAPELKRFLAKLRVYSIGHQDDSGPWIVENFPDLFFVLAAADPSDVSRKPQKGPDRRLSLYRGMYLGGDESLTSGDWIDTKVRTNHGPLGALYPPKTWTTPNPYGALKEGDTPSWFYFLALGLSSADHPDWGGWGGRFHESRRHFFNDAADTVNGVTDARASVWRWRTAYQNDFAARMDWCAQSDRTKANHPPKATLNGDSSRRIMFLRTKPGEHIRLNASGSSDPDGNNLRYRWYVYREAGTYRGVVRLKGETSANAELVTPEVTRRATIHIILEVTDDGQPALTSFRRVVISF